MSKRFSVNAWGPGADQVEIIRLHIDWQCPYGSYESLELYPGWLCLSVVLFGFGVSLTYWRHHKPDVYGDGGVA